MSRRLVMLLLAAGACRPLELPEPPGAGNIQGTLTYEGPGGETVPAGGATVELLGTPLSTVADAQTGFFRLSPVPTDDGTVLIRFDANGDGTPDHSRAISLTSIQAGPGRTSALGNLVLAGTAQVRGTVLRADLLGTASAHGQSSVFTPAGPYLVLTGGNGGFSLAGLPEGEVTLAFFRAGYRSQETTVTLKAGQTLSLPTVILAVDETVALPTRVTGTATLFGQASSEGIQVTTSGGQTAATDAEGVFNLDLPAGLYSFGYQRDGFATVVLRNIAVTGGDVQIPQVVLTQGATSPPDLVPPGAGGGSGTGGGTGAGGGTATGGGDAATGGGGAAGGDAGGGPTVPFAVITPLPAFRAYGTSTQLSGAGSDGGTPPYRYFWTQDGGTVAVTLSANNGLNAAQPTFTTPTAAGGPQLLRFQLRIEDVLGVSSTNLAEVTLPVGPQPTAAISTPPATVFPSQQIQLSAAGSTDPGGTGLTQYLWTVSPSGVVTLSGAQTSTLTLTMPTSVPAPQVITVSLSVVSGIGIPSTPTQVQFTLSNQPAPPWIIDAGPPQTVRDGIPVTLSGLASAPGNPGATFTYQWSPAVSDGGTFPWSLSNPTSPSTQFVSPLVVGPSVQLSFTLTATSASGLSPPSQVATTWVNVFDQTAPSLVGSSIVDGRAGSLGIWLDWSEPVTFTTGLGVSGVSPVGGLSTLERLSVEGGTRAVLLSTPLLPTTTHQVNFGGAVRDLSPLTNALSLSTLPFIAEARMTGAFESIGSSDQDPRPGVVLRPGAARGSIEALVFGRNGNQPWFLQAFDPTACTAGPCPVPTDTSAPATALASTTFRGKRGLALGSTAYAMLQPGDPAAGVPPVTFRRAGGSWAAMSPSPPGSLYTDGTTLLSTYVDSGGVRVASTVPFQGDSFDLAGAQVVASNPDRFSLDGGSLPVPLGTAPYLQATHEYLAVKASKNNDVWTYRKDGASAWAQFGPYTDTVDHRIVTMQTNGYVVWTTSAQQLRAVLFGNANNSATLAGGVTGFDVIARSNGQLWIVYAENGLLQLRVIIAGQGLLLSTAPGFEAALNNDPMCVADSPEIVQYRERLGIAWAERCGAQWRMYFRLLN